ncbi:MAG: hypothetical protein PGN27_04305 [Mycolicibacterium neoaurum]|uniref:hypothetical protein n=1 Tax=Mycolicibacterium neoaurum TaxID=1795 RepID=UPI002FFD10D4
MDEWTVRRDRGSLLVIANNTGHAVTRVEMRLKGAAVGGTIARRDWSAKRAEMQQGDYVAAPFKVAMGARSNPPRIEITWTDHLGGERGTALTDLPL